MAKITKQLTGVCDATVSFEHGFAEIVYDPTEVAAVTIAKLITERSGFVADLPKAES